VQLTYQCLFFLENPTFQRHQPVSEGGRDHR
jgi:hypothetical protein